MPVRVGKPQDPRELEVKQRGQSQQGLKKKSGHAMWLLRPLLVVAMFSTQVCLVIKLLLFFAWVWLLLDEGFMSLEAGVIVFILLNLTAMNTQNRTEMAFYQNYP
jgi:hypothetical protein